MSESSIFPNHFRDASDAMAAMREGAVTSVELTALCFERIKALDESIHAMIVSREKEAMTEAVAADQRRAAGEDLPLLGLPVSVKEAFNIEGLPTTWGLPEFAHHLAAEDAGVVRSLKAAGAIIIGKTNVPVMLGNYEAENPVYGRTNNPYDPDRTPGGSSGGSAAALASGQTFLECGSDLGGSIRQPAHSCGVFGIKPTWGIIPQDGHLPPFIPAEASSFIDSPAVSQIPAVGPMARSARDLALALPLLARPRGKMSRAYRWEMPVAPQEQLSDFRIGYVLDHPAATPEVHVGAKLSDLIHELERAGVKMKEGWPEGIDPLHIRDLRFYLRAAMDFILPPEERRARIEDALKGPEFPAGDLELLLKRGLADRVPERISRLIEAEHLQAIWEDYFSEYDLFLTPVQNETAFFHGKIRDEAIEAAHFWWAAPSVLSFPAAVAPLGLAADGLPVGVQIMGPLYADSIPIKFSQLLEVEGLAGFVPPLI
jgi:amidase